MKGITKNIKRTCSKYHQEMVKLEIWRLQQWNNSSEDTNRRDAQLACSTKGKRGKQPIGARADDSDVEDDNEGMVCQMNGEQWEPLPFPIIIDSGACTSVMPTAWCQHVPIYETKGSRAGEFFKAANGDKIYKEGRKEGCIAYDQRGGGQRYESHIV